MSLIVAYVDLSEYGATVCHIDTQDRLLHDTLDDGPTVTLRNMSVDPPSSGTHADIVRMCPRPPRDRCA